MIDFPVIKFLQTQLSIDDYIKWLEERTDGMVVGKRRNAINCPIYFFLKSLPQLDKYTIQLDNIRIRLIRERNHIYSHYHSLYQPWIEQYIILVDSEKGTITKEQALALALELKEKQNVRP